MRLNKKTLFLIVVAIIVSVIFFLLKNDEPFKRVSLKTHKPQYVSWDAIFQHPRDITVKSFTTGKLNAPLSGLVNLDNPKMKDKKDIVISIPILAHIVHHRKQGYFLVDLGFDSSYQQKPYGSTKGLILEYIIGKGSQNPGQDINSIIKKKKITISKVFLTHLHFDHVAGALNLPKNIRYITGKNETLINNVFFESHHLDHIMKLYGLDFSRANEITPLGRAIDVFGDNSFWAIETTGHTDGHISYLVNGKKEKVFLLGDAVSVRLSLETGVGPGSYSSDVEQAQVTMDKIMAFKKQYPKVKMICGHEM